MRQRVLQGDKSSATFSGSSTSGHWKSAGQLGTRTHFAPDLQGDFVRNGRAMAVHEAHIDACRVATSRGEGAVRDVADPIGAARLIRSQDVVVARLREVPVEPACSLSRSVGAPAVKVGLRGERLANGAELLQFVRLVKR